MTSARKNRAHTRSSRSHLSKPRGKVSEAKASYAIQPDPASDKTAVKHLEFHIVLPQQTHVERFTDLLIELVEKAGGTVAGGIV